MITKFGHKETIDGETRPVRYVTPIEREMQEEFKKIINEIDSCSHALILSDLSEREVFLRLRDNNGYIGKGYEGANTYFAYKNHILQLMPAPFYPFTDENHPGRFCVMLRQLYDGYKTAQASYLFAYDGMETLDAAIRRASEEFSYTPELYKPPIDTRIGKKEKGIIDGVIRKNGSVRERIIYEPNLLVASYVFKVGHTWNDDHKVVDVHSLADDMRFEYFSIDVHTQKICG